MNPHDAFDRILALLHQSALNGNHWPAVATLIEEAIGAEGSILVVAEGFGDDARLYLAEFLYRGESYPDRVREYFDVYYANDEGVPRLRQIPRGQLVHAPDLYTEDELKTSPGYNEGLRLLGNQHGLAARFDGADGLRIIWGVADPVDSGGYGSAQLRLAERLLPHIRHFVLVRQALAAGDALGTGLAGLLDGSGIGVLYLDRGGRVVAANDPARDLLRRGDGLYDKDGALHAWLPADHERLQELLRDALPRFGHEAPTGGSMTLQRPSSGGRLGLQAIPVGDAEADFGGCRVAALMLVVDPARPLRIDPVRVAQVLGLSAAEARAAALLAAGNSAHEIAALAGWQEGYVRWLLSQVNKKHGLSGQVELVRRVLAAEAFVRR